MARRGDFRVGVLGTGAIAQVVHLPTLGQMSGVELIALCDVDRAKAVTIASRFNVPQVHATDEAVFADPAVDGVIICTPSNMHEEQAIAALEAGKHVLVEKPVALSAEGAKRVLEAAQRAGKAFMVAMNHRFRPDIQALRPFIKGGELGDLFFLKSGWLNRKVRVLRPTWRHRRATAGGGALMDLGVQALDLCLWMIDYEPVRRIAAYLHYAEGMEVEDSAAVLAETESGAVISVEVTWNLLAQRDRHYIQVLGTQGSASLSPLSVFKEVEHGLLDVTPQLPPTQGNVYTASYRQQLRHFVEVAQGRKPLELPEEQAGVMRLVALAYQSAAEGRAVEV